MISEKLIVKSEKYKFGEFGGITLISLVITIIILIILAWCAISLSLGENGLFIKAKYAKEEYLNIQESEEQQINDLYSKMLVATNENSQITVNIEDLRKIINEQILNSYPIGSIYISTTATNPSDFIGGQWESYGEGRTLIGAGKGIDINSTTMEFIANSIGGEYKHVLTMAQLPNIQGSFGCAVPNNHNMYRTGVIQRELLIILFYRYNNGKNKSINDVGVWHKYWK